MNGFMERSDVEMKLTAEECFAKAEVYDQCAEFLHSEWTDDETEWILGKKISDGFRKMSIKWTRKGHQRMKNETT